MTHPSSNLEDSEFFECRLDGGAWAVCESPRGVTGSPPPATFRQRTRSSVDEPEPARRARAEGRPGAAAEQRWGAPPAPPAVVLPTVGQRRAAAAAGLRVVASRPKRRARRVVLGVASVVPAAVRVTA